MVQSNTRVFGSNFSTFRWRGQPIAYLERVSDGGQAPIARVQAIHPLGESHPTEFAMPMALSYGTIQLTVRELWNMPVWQHLQGLTNANDLIDVWRVLQADPTAVTCQQIVKPPQANYWRVKTYHNVVVSDIDDSETFEIATMTVPRTITCVYTHATRSTVTAGGS